MKNIIYYLNAYLLGSLSFASSNNQGDDGGVGLDSDGSEGLGDVLIS